MDILALILACSIHPDDAFTRVLVDVQSGGNVYFVGDLATLKTVDNLSGAAEGLRVVDELRRNGGRPAVGLLGVPIEWAARFGHQPKDLFDACTNLAVGSAMLSEYQDECTARPRRPGRPHRASIRQTEISRPPLASQRSCVLAKFARGLGLKSAPEEVLRLLEQRGTPPVVDSPPAQSPIFTDGDDGNEAGWSNPRMYLDPGEVASATASTSKAVPPPPPSPRAKQTTVMPLPVLRGRP